MNNVFAFLRHTKSIGEFLGAHGTLSRVEVKTGRLRNGAILFNTYSSTIRINESKNRRHSQVRWAQPYLIDIVDIPELRVGLESLNGVSNSRPNSAVVA